MDALRACSLFTGSSEAAMIYLGLPWFQKTKWGTLEMPNAHNFGWDMHLFLLIFMSSYVFGTTFSTHRHSQVTRTHTYSLRSADDDAAHARSA